MEESCVHVPRNPRAYEADRSDLYLRGMSAYRSTILIAVRPLVAVFELACGAGSLSWSFLTSRGLFSLVELSAAASMLRRVLYSSAVDVASSRL